MSVSETPPHIPAAIPRPLRIIVVDDHAITRAGIVMTLRAQGDIDVVEVLSDGTGVIEAARRTECDMVLLDLDLPGVHGKTILAELVGVLDTTVIVVTGSSNASDLSQAVRAGARGVVAKGDETEDLLEAIAACRTGQTFLTPSISGYLDDYSPPTVRLSPRQTAILALMDAGESNKEIAYRLGITAPTVSFHLTQLREKLGASSNRQIVRRAQDLGHI